MTTRLSPAAQAFQTAGLYLLASLGILASVLRTRFLADTLQVPPTGLDPVDARYVEIPWLALAHVLPGILFLLIGPLQFLPALRSRWPGLHRGLGRVYILCGLVSALSTPWLVLALPAMGGPLTIVTSWAFSLWMALALVLALRAIRARDWRRHRAWMIRAFAVGLAISTIRLLGILADLLLGIDFNDAFGAAVLGGFCLHALVAEGIIARHRPLPRAARGPSLP